MNEIVRGRCFPWDLKDFKRRHFVAVVDDTRKEKEDIEVLILPIEDGKVGGFEQEQMECLGAAIGFLGFTDNDLVRGLKSLRAALSRLFEEVESED